MDFRTAPFVIDALKKRLEHEVLGYTFACKEWAESIINWLKERHGWTISEDMLTFTPGIVRGLAFAIHCFTEKGDKVMVMPPVYHPFFLVTQKNEREVVFSPLILKDGQYHIDFNRFRKDASAHRFLRIKNTIFSSPLTTQSPTWKSSAAGCAAATERASGCGAPHGAMRGWRCTGAPDTPCPGCASSGSGRRPPHT